MTERIKTARERVLSTVQLYAPVHAQFSEEALRRLNNALDEHHNAVVEATLASQPVKPVAPVIDPNATSVVKLNEPAPSQPDAVGDPEPHDPAPLPSVADQAAGKPVKPPKGKPSIDKPPQ
jgi:hypothetical protein